MIRACLASLLLFAASAFADPIATLTLGGPASDSGFGFSYLHTASGGGTGFAMSGSVTPLSGSFEGEWNDATKTLKNITGTFTAGNNALNAYLGLGAGETLTVTIFDGALRGDLNVLGLPGGALAGGYLQYAISGNVSGFVDRGRFDYFPKTFVPAADPSPNSLDVDPLPGDDYAFWGNNWVNATASLATTWTNLANSLGLPSTFFTSQPDGTGAGFTRLGTDLRGPTTLVPEPGTLALVALGGLVLLRRRRRA